LKHRAFHLSNFLGAQGLTHREYLQTNPHFRILEAMHTEILKHLGCRYPGGNGYRTGTSGLLRVYGDLESRTITARRT